jgi:hypothetical protein
MSCAGATPPMAHDSASKIQITDEMGKDKLLNVYKGHRFFTQGSINFLPANKQSRHEMNGLTFAFVT